MTQRHLEIRLHSHFSVCNTVTHVLDGHFEFMLGGVTLSGGPPSCDLVIVEEGGTCEEDEQSKSYLGNL